MTLHFTGRSDVEDSAIAWYFEWVGALMADDKVAEEHAAQMRDRMARALREGE